jgi:hypothetical protein
MAAEILLKLSHEIDAATPQLMLVAAARQAGAVLGLALVSCCSAALETRAAPSPGAAATARWCSGLRSRGRRATPC